MSFGKWSTRECSPVWMLLALVSCTRDVSLARTTAADLGRDQREAVYRIAAAQCDGREACPGVHSPRDQCIVSRLDETARLTGLGRCALVSVLVTQCVEILRSSTCDISLERINACTPDALCAE